MRVHSAQARNAGQIVPRDIAQDALDEMEVDTRQACELESPLHGDVGRISVVAWFRYVSRRLAVQQQRPLDELRSAFRAMGHRCQGSVTRQQWLSTVAKHAPHLDKQATNDAYSGLVGGNDVLTIERFFTLMRASRDQRRLRTWL